MNRLQCIVLLSLLVCGCMTQKCPPVLQPIGDTVFTLRSVTGPSDVQFRVCGTLDTPTGCSVPGGGNVCTGPGCCSVCQRWRQNDPYPGAACLGTLTSYTINATTIVLRYLDGDVVHYPTTTPRETFVIIKCDGSSPVGDWKYIDASELPGNGQYYQYFLITSSNLCGNPDNGKLDPGFPTSIVFPAYYAVKQMVHIGAAITFIQPEDTYTLNMSVKCSSSCLFKVYLLDETNMLNFMTNQPFVCQNSMCNTPWAQYDVTVDIDAKGGHLYVLVLPQAPATLAIQVAAFIPSSRDALV